MSVVERYAGEGKDRRVAMFVNPKTYVSDGEQVFLEAVVAELRRLEKPKVPWGAWVVAGAAVYFGMKVVKVLKQ